MSYVQYFQSNQNLELGAKEGEKPQVNNGRCTWKTCMEENCKKILHKPCSFWKCDTVIENLKPLLYFTGIWEIFIGLGMVVVVVGYADKIDFMFGTVNTKLISLLMFGGLVFLAVSGMVLVISVLLDKRSLMWIYTFMSTFMCFYIVVLSILMIEFSIYKPTSTYDKYQYVSTPTLIGLCILLCSVFHFIGTVAVFTYYTLKYIHPTMFCVVT